MDHSFPYHQPLAQMPTDQREHEHDRVLVQTGLSGADGLFQATNTNDSDPQAYHPGPPVEHWSTFRSNLMPQSLTSLHHTGFSHPWGTTLEPYDFGISSPIRAQMPHDGYLASLYCAPHVANLPSVFDSSTTNMHHSNSHAPRRSDRNDLTKQQTTPVTAFSNQEHLIHFPQHPSTPQSSERVIRATSPSTPISISSDHSLAQSSEPRRIHDSMSPALAVAGVDSPSPRISLADSSDQEQSGEPPYSRLIWGALMSADDKMLPLQGIYQWFEKNTTKGKNDESKGWQNSIRHNLSMNAGFEPIKIETPGKKTVNYWRLTAEAIRNGGVQSTTRYRKLTAKKAMSSGSPDPRRQRPGSKGGKMSAGVKRHATEDEEEDGDPSYPFHYRNVRQNRSPSVYSQSHSHSQPQPQPHIQLQPPASADADIHHFQHYNHTYLTTPSVGVPQYATLHSLYALPQTARESWQQFDLRNVIGTTDQPPTHNMLFCDTAEGAPDCAAFVEPWLGLPRA